MGRFVLRRLLHGLVVVVGVTVFVFVVTRLIGDPVDVMLPLEATAEQRAAFAHRLGFDQPIYVQFFDYARDAAVFDFGDSLWQDRPAMQIVFEHLPRTLVLVGSALLLAVAIAIPTGILAALRPGRLVDRIATTTSLVGMSMPNFWLGLLLILLFAVRLGWFPTSGMGTWRHAVLPIVTFALPPAARISMLVRSSMIDELNKQYVQMARAKNIGFLRVIGKHAFRNASVPTLTISGWELISALAGYSVVVETVFAWPGLGFLALQSIVRQDLILLQAIVFVIALVIVAINMVVDISYKALDPRIKLA